MEYCELCNIRKVTHRNVLFRQSTPDWRPLNVTKDICDKCFNEIKPKETDAPSRKIVSCQLSSDVRTSKIPT